MSEIADPMIEALCVALSERGLGPVSKVPGGDGLAALVSGSADLGWVCGLEHSRVRDDPHPALTAIAAPVMQQHRYGGLPVYFGDVIVASNAATSTVDELEGLTFVRNETSSLSGHHMMERALHHRGRTVGDWFGTVIDSGAHELSLHAVATGTADCAVIDSTVLDMARLRGDPHTDAVRVIDSFGPYPVPPFVVASGRSDELGPSLTAAMMDVAADGALCEWGIAAIVPVSDDRYTDLVSLTERPAT